MPHPNEFHYAVACDNTPCEFPHVDAGSAS
jgi:hypothetical protein